MASVWSPPSYMKDPLFELFLLSGQERNYYYFIKNITAIIKDQFNINIERVSPINEPENVAATWEHTIVVNWDIYAHHISSKKYFDF